MDFEIILVDDASTDETDALVQRYSDMRIDYVRHERNSGLVSTLNDGFPRVQGDFIARIDGDDRYRRDYLKRTLPLFKTHPEIGLVSGDAGLIDATGSVVADYWDAPASRYFHDNRDFKGNEYLETHQAEFHSCAHGDCTPGGVARRLSDSGMAAAPVSRGGLVCEFSAARRHEFYYLAQTIADYRLHGRNWHPRPTFDRSYEGGVVGIMDQFFGEPDYAAAKQEMRRTCYGDLYTFLGNRYFGLGMRQDAATLLHEGGALPSRIDDSVPCTCGDGQRPGWNRNSTDG